MMGKNDLAQRKPNRLKDHDYSQPGYYFITICTHQMRQLFWSPQPLVGAACGRPPLSPWGQYAEDELVRLSGIYSNALLDKHVVMPNHVHLILRILEPDGGRPQAAPTIPRIINQFKGRVSKQAGKAVWQKGYYDHVIRTESAYLRIWNYIDTNPARWQEDEYYTHL